MAKKAFVTGASGFIGSHLVERLIRDGYHVKALVRYSSSKSLGWLNHINLASTSNLTIVYGDILETRNLENYISDCSVVFHLASMISVPYSIQAPEYSFLTNACGCQNLLNACIKTDPSHIIMTSTSEVYGTAQFVPITEGHPMSAQSPYAASKVAADQLALSYYHSYGLPISILRPFNTYGPRQSRRAVIPTIITQALRNYGKVSLGETLSTRDFNYVADTVNAFISVSRCPATIGHIMNSATGYDISIRDTASLVGDLLGMTIDIQDDSSRLRPNTSEVMRLQGSSSLLRELTGWAPEFSGLNGFAAGLRHTIDWIRANPQGTDYQV